MKKYLFGLGAMLVGAGLMFVLMHTDVNAESEADFDFLCKQHSSGLWDKKQKEFLEYTPLNIVECKKGKTTCYVHGGLSCFNTGILK